MSESRNIISGMTKNEIEALKEFYDSALQEIRNRKENDLIEKWIQPESKD